MKKSTKILAILIITIMMGALILRPSVYIQAAKDGLNLFAISVLPALLPFFIFTKLLTALGVSNALSRYAKKPTERLFNAPPIASYIFAMSVLSGYPIGAKLTADAYENNLLTSEEANSIISFTSTSGPIFVLGTVGTIFLENYVYGLVILICHYSATIINGLLFRSRSYNFTQFTTKYDYDNVLELAINTSISSIMQVGVYMMLFNMVIALLYDFNILGNLPIIIEGSLSGLIEVTQGIKILTSSNINKMDTLPIIGFLVSFGGLSVTMQSLTFLSKCKVSTGRYLITKFSQGALTYAFISLVVGFF